MTPYTYADGDGDRIIEFNELQFSTSRSVLGSSLPSRAASVLSTWTFSRGLTFSGLLDYRGGQKLANLNEANRCSRFLNCRAVNDQTSSLAEQAQAVAGFNTPLPFVDGASFAKLREVSLRWVAPSGIASWIGGPAAITIAGRNLATWTHYRGLDPELTSQNQPRVDLAETPLPREFLVRFDLGGRASRS
jgi:hypothetical protein